MQTYTYPQKDKYGRSCLIGSRNARTVAVRVAIPKRTRHLTGYHYIVADWENNESHKCATLADANRLFTAILNR